MGLVGLLSGCLSGGGVTKARVVVAGGGFAGATCARTLAQLGIRVTLVEPNPVYTACPFSNLVISTDRPIQAQQFSYAGIANAGVEVRHARVVGVDAQRVQLDDGSRLDYDRLVLAPGIEINWDGLPGYDQAAAELMPHAWQAGAQTLLLRRQLRAMPDGGVVVISVPDNPYRCPPGPYERASLIAHYLKAHKPRSKVLILDAKDRFSKQPLFTRAWQEQYGQLVEWQGRSAGAAVVEVDAQSGAVLTDFETVRGDVINVIPPQRAGFIAQTAGAADNSGWCPIQAGTFESTRLDRVHVLGDAAIANAMPKSAFSANAQAKLCAVQVARLLADQPPQPAKLINTCYSLIAPEYGISVAGVYTAEKNTWRSIPGAGGISPMLQAPAGAPRLEAEYARAWYATITREVFGG